MSKISSYANGAPLLGSDVWPVARGGAMRGIAGKDSLLYHTRRNFLDNPLFNVAQRGNSVLTTAAAVTLDRWVAMQATSAAGFAQQQTSSTSARFKRARVGRTAAANNTGLISFAQALETQDAIILAGQPICFAFEGLAGAQFSAASGNLNVAVVYGTGTDQTSASMLAGGWTGYTSLTLNASAAALSSAAWAAYAFTGTLPAGATQIGVILSYVPVGVAGADDAFYLTNTWFGYGDTPPPVWNNPDPAWERMRCMRHLPAFAGTGFRLIGSAISNGSGTTVAPFAVPPRIAPTGISLSAVADFSIYSSSSNATGACNGLTYSVAGTESGSILPTWVAGTPTAAAGVVTQLFGNTANAKLLFTGAEL